MLQTYSTYRTVGKKLRNNYTTEQPDIYYTYYTYVHRYIIKVRLKLHIYVMLQAKKKKKQAKTNHYYYLKLLKS